MCCILGFNSCLALIEIEKSGMYVWLKNSSSKNKAVDSN